MSKPILIAIGGNSLIRAGQSGSVPEQMENAGITCRNVAELAARGHRIVITHGNGPQAGAQLIRSEMASLQVYELPLDSCVASTQGELGYILQNAMRSALHALGLNVPVITILTQVVVNEADPAFSKPSKPIGPFFSKEVAEKRANDLGWDVIEDAARGYRRVVASPSPLEIVETEAIRHCISEGFIVIALGGGGIPVIEKDGICHGSEAVVDKDAASALLANRLGVETLVVSTDVEKVCLNFKKPNQIGLDAISLAQAKEYLAEGHFLTGSMGPKIEAAADFLSKGGKEVIITRPEQISDALNGNAGTRIFANEEEAGS